MENKNDFLNIKEEVEELGIEHILAILPILRKMPPVEVAEILNELDAEAIAFVLKILI